MLPRRRHRLADRGPRYGAIKRQWQRHVQYLVQRPGSSDSYGGAHGFATSSSGSIANALGRGTVGGGGSVGAGLTSAITTSTAAVVSPGSGYAQVQTSGYAGGSVSGFGGRAR